MPDNISDEESIGTLVSRLIEDAKTFARAQVDLYRAQALKVVADYRAAVILCVVAVILAHMAIIVLLIGILLSIARALGPIWATVITVGGTLAVAAVLVALAVSMIRAAGAKGKVR